MKKLTYREELRMRKEKKAEKTIRTLRVSARRSKNYFNMAKDMESLAA